MCLGALGGGQMGCLTVLRMHACMCCCMMAASCWEQSAYARGARLCVAEPQREGARCAALVGCGGAGSERRAQRARRRDLPGGRTVLLVCVSCSPRPPRANM